MRARVRRRLVFCAAALCGLGVAGPVTCFGTPMPLSPPGVTADLSFNFKKSIATLPDGSVHAVWHEDRAAGRQVVYRRSLDRGSTWEPPLALSAPGAGGEHPAIAASAGTVYVGWHETRGDGREVVLRRGPGAGAFFEAPLTLSTSGGGTHISLAAHGSRVYATWGDVRTGVAEIYVRASEDAGRTFHPEWLLSDEPYASWVPNVDAWDDVAVVAWVDYRDANEEEYLRVSRNGGRSWEPAIRVTHDPADSWAPSVAVRGEAIFLTWFDRRAAGLLDGDVEAALDSIMALLGLPVTPAPPRDPAVYYLPEFNERVDQKRAAILAAAPGWVADGGDEAVLEAALSEFDRRMETWSRGWGIYFRRSPDLGESWEPARAISTPGGPAARPSLDVDGADVHVAWYDQRHGPAEVYARRSADHGTSFGPELRLTRSPGSSLRPSLAAEGPLVYVLWTEDGEIRTARGHPPAAE